MSDPSRYPASYYAASAHPFPVCPSLAGTVVTDVCVVGAGITGLAAAISLAERGLQVVVLEAEAVGWGASGRNGGQLLNGYACGQERLASLVGVDSARELWALSLEAVEQVRSWVERFRIRCDLRWGALAAAIRPRQVQDLRAWMESMELQYGYRALRFIDGDALPGYVRSPRYRAAVLDAGGGHLHPLNYTLGLARAAREMGVTLYERSRATAIGAGDPVAVRTASGEVRARYVVLAGNAYLGYLAPAIRARIMPVGTYVGATEPLQAARARRLLPTGACVSDTNFVLDYFRLSADHRLLFGGLVSYSTLSPPNLAVTLRRRMLRVFPDLADVSMAHAWGGFVDITMNRAPDFGRIGPNVYYLQGFSGHGLALANLAGRVVAEAVAGQAERFDAFARIPHRAFPGGRALRTPALVLAMLYYRLRDLLP